MRVIERIKDFFTLHLRRNKMCKWLRKASSRPRRRSSSKESRYWLSVLVFLITYGPTPSVNWRFAKIGLTKRTLHKFVASQIYVPLLVLIIISCALYLRYPSKDYIMIKIILYFGIASLANYDCNVQFENRSRFKAKLTDLSKMKQCKSWCD